jgi:hypothetical protein
VHKLFESLEICWHKTTIEGNCVSTKTLLLQHARGTIELCLTYRKPWLGSVQAPYLVNTDTDSLPRDTKLHSIGVYTQAAGDNNIPSR